MNDIFKIVEKYWVWIGYISFEYSIYFRRDDFFFYFDIRMDVWKIKELLLFFYYGFGVYVIECFYNDLFLMIFNEVL